MLPPAAAGISVLMCIRPVVIDDQSRRTLCGRAGRKRQYTHYCRHLDAPCYFHVRLPS
jgi:hypothetical protein